MTQSGNNPLENAPVPPAGKDPSWWDALAIPLGLLGALAGAFLGGWIMWLGFHSGYLVIPVQGLLIGFGTILASRRGGWIQGLIAGIVCLLATFLTHWRIGWPNAGMDADAFRDYLSHLSGFLLLLHAVSVIVASWIAWSAPARRK